ncbi:hypothetical protein Poly24_28030 [Rosistilla carotiformis]|uniref:Uncharacterized protein n=1 Tax=Rosistilla carotiformis TaxID=2528017 RepID=A0A518JU63_9BACT|nr:hypothetical protein Poly24_28030 [Rosistilla carotiformis]
MADRANSPRRWRIDELDGYPIKINNALPGQSIADNSVQQWSNQDAWRLSLLWQPKQWMVTGATGYASAPSPKSPGVNRRTGSHCKSTGCFGMEALA